MGIEREIEHFQGQFTAGNQIRPFAAHPAWIMLQLRQEDRVAVAVVSVGRGGERRVHGRIEDFNDLPVGFDAIRNVNRLLERAYQSLGDRCFAVTGGPIDQDRAARIGRGAETPHDILGKHKMGKGPAKFFYADHFVGYRLLLHLHLIAFEGNGHRTDIFAKPQCLTGPFFARVGKSVAHDVEILFRRAANLHQRLFFSERQKLLYDAPGELDLLGKLWNGLQGRSVHRPEQTV